MYDKKFQTISMVGLGYIGLPTAALFASRKVKVIGVDVNQKAVDTINKGEIHIVEPDLDMIVHAAVTEGYLKATTTPEPAEAFLVAVPTPFKEGNVPDLKYIESAAKSIAPVLEKGNLVILESTSPVGATEQMAKWLADARPDLTFPQSHGNNADVQIAHCPERVLPGKVVTELVSNDRVIGGMSDKANDMAIALYKTFVEGECITTDSRTAEMAKLTENSFRDVNIAFANELSLICDELDINVWELIELANRHPRVNILQPGAGVGGHCIAVDPWFIVDSAPEQAKIIKMARDVNNYKPQWVVEKVKAAITDVQSQNPDKNLSNITVACLGMAFKPDIDDLRESPAMQIVKDIAKIGCQVAAVEPNIHELPESIDHSHVSLNDLSKGLENADIVVVLVKHKQFIEQAEYLKQHSCIIDAVGI
ncbi:UDP-N-acetyl-D-mannosaminuronic acid dehydrogenase [Idiomarina fontislapidosi]|uniref:UDP-N-acetyl-D-mannosamine dehydrogenase n=1 Tax=Idiomarina fontislapidosi TaxID=263723 RepID=A0A432XQX3_9GAMM|nr:UDP-N-acetyl-D-mannosamine dehydrogenase [Idiomarina fontislapidosi]PYE30717.1 UDP-N-acetyl-D-mannosaminuronic acid dehydrogenase [Idiomarina fontislapidosi]RUO51116.1 UDP-N-acetyl-D-mannosamine dehydrogenase [Idiomarina fontislapidosi]